MPEQNGCLIRCQCNLNANPRNQKSQRERELPTNIDIFITGMDKIRSTKLFETICNMVSVRDSASSILIPGRGENNGDLDKLIVFDKASFRLSMTAKAQFRFL